MSLEDRCRFNENGEAIVEQGPDEKPEGFLFRLVNLKSPAGREPNFARGKWGEPIRIYQKNSVLEIKDGAETHIMIPYGIRITVKYKTGNKKNGCELIFPEGSNGLDLSRVQLVDRAGVRYFLGSGDIVKGMSWFLPDGVEVSSKLGDWTLVADRYGEDCVDFRAN